MEYKMSRYISFKGLHYHSLSFRLVIMIIIAVIPGLIASFQVGLEHRSRELSRIQEDVLSMVRLSADDQEEVLTRNTPTLLRLMTSLYPEVKSKDGPKISALFSRMLKEYPNFINIMAADSLTGEVYASGLPLNRPLNLADRPYFEKTLKTNNYVIGEFALGKATGKPTIVCSYPVSAGTGNIHSIIAVGIDVERMAKHSAAAQPNKDVVITLFDRNGTIIFNSHNHEKLVGKNIFGSAMWNEIKGKNGEGLYNGTDYDGIESIIAFKPLIGTSGRGDGYVAAGIERGSAIKSANRYLGQSLIGIVIGTALAFLFGLFFGHRSILRNVNSLVNAAESLAEGNMGIRTDITGKTEEFKRLSNAFDMMSEKLQQRMEAQKAAEKALFDEKEQLMVTLRSIGDGVITTDSSGFVLLMNTMAEVLTGWGQEEAEGKPLEEVFHIIHEETRERSPNPLGRIKEGGKTSELSSNAILVRRDGIELIISDSCAPIIGNDNNIIGAVLVIRDITDKRKLEDDIIKAEKLDSLGLLAGGISHDFNNLLTAILGNISLASRDLKMESPVMDMLSKAENAALRARDLTSQLLSFTTGGFLQKKTVAISGMVREITEFVLSGSNVSCEFMLPDDLLDVEIDKGQLTQVINNLVLNAIQSMEGGGRIIVNGENVDIGAGSQIPLPPKRYVRISIKDHGSGIPDSHIEKIFDPYFTTKEGGIGLGLASTYYIIKRHEGYITVDSTPGAGTTFHIYLPSSVLKAPVKEDRHGRFTGTGRILIMDDEPMVRDIGKSILAHLGFQADTSVNGHEAVARYDEAMKSGMPYTAVILDLTVPGSMGGREAAEIIMRIDPSARILASSGYSNDAAMTDFKSYGFCGVIPKPYIIDEIQKVLADILQ